MTSLKWTSGPEALTKRNGCTSRAEHAGVKYEVHRVWERSLISGRSLPMSQLYVDGRRVGRRQPSFTDCRALAAQLARGERPDGVTP